MKKILLLPYILLTALLFSCAGEELIEQTASTETGSEENGDMLFLCTAATLTRASSNGVYQSSVYPVDQLFLTAYHRDYLLNSQWYFMDIRIQAEKNADGHTYWRAPGWYWPIQGNMEFLSYWSPKVFGSPKFYEFHHPDGLTSAQMEIHADGTVVAEQGYSEGKLDGYTDFLYIAEQYVRCPQTTPKKLEYKHGLSWITMTLQANVAGEDGNYSEEETLKLIEFVKVRKIVIQQVSRSGVAYLVPGRDVAWLPSEQKDQVYYRPENLSLDEWPRGTYNRFTWEEVDDGRAFDAKDYVTLSPKEQNLGEYTVQDQSGDYVGNGLLLVPQHKTSITVHYVIKDGKVQTDEFGNVLEDEEGNPLTEDLEVAQRFELRDNEEDWLPGVHYHYQINFTSSADKLKEERTGIQLIETSFEIERDPSNGCFKHDEFGQLIIKGSDGSSRTFSEPVFILDPMHNSGSPFHDEMDYHNGGSVF